eukprot:gene42-635_t
MAQMYHEQVPNDIFYIDATGTVTGKSKGFPKMLHYVAAIRHPFGKPPQLPVAEFITTSYAQFSIRHFLMAIHEKKYRKYKANTSNPGLILIDFSWAIILVCFGEFCMSDLKEYINRTYRIVMGLATKDDLEKTLIHVCLAHVMTMNRKEAKQIATIACWMCWGEVLRIPAKQMAQLNIS